MLIMNRTNLFQQFSPAAGQEGCLTPVAQAHEFGDFGSGAMPLGEGWRLAAASGILRRATMKLVSMVER